MVLVKNMNPDNIPFNALIARPTNSGKTRYLVNLLSTTFQGKFDYIVLLCPTFIHNITYDGFGENDKDLLILFLLQDQIDDGLKIISYMHEGTDTLIILNDSAALRDVSRGQMNLWIKHSEQDISESVFGTSYDRWQALQRQSERTSFH